MMSIRRSAAGSFWISDLRSLHANPPGPFRSPSLSQLSAARCRLLDRITRRGLVIVNQTYPVGPLRFAFTRIADPDTVLDKVVQDEDRREKITGRRLDGNDLHLPYWAELWDSALGLAQYLEEKSAAMQFLMPLKQRKTVLDLGCGMGFVGMVAAALGAQVLLADLEPDALLFAQLNTLPWAAQTRTRRLNWQTDRLDETFDIIFGADVLYDRSQWDHLEPFFRAHLRPGGWVLLGEPGRQTGELFPQWIASHGWNLQHFEQPVSTRPGPIRIFRASIAANSRSANK